MNINSKKDAIKETSRGELNFAPKYRETATVNN